MLRRIDSGLGWIALSLILLSAIAVAALKYAFPAIGTQKTKIESYLSSQTGTRIQIGSIKASWEQLYPTLIISDLESTSDSEQGPVRHLKIHKLEAKFDFFASVYEWAPIFASLKIAQAEIALWQQEGRWVAVDSGETKNSSEQLDFSKRLIQTLIRQPEASFENISLLLHPETGDVRYISPMVFSLNNARDQHRIYGSAVIHLPTGTSDFEFAIEAGRLPEEQPLEGAISFYARAKNLGQHLLELKAIELPITPTRLELDTEVWATLDKGRITALQGDVELSQLEFQEEGLDTLQASRLTFSLQPTQHEQYQLVISDMLLSTVNQQLLLPKQFVNFRWKSGTPQLLNVGATELDLLQLSDWFKNKPYVHEEIQDALVTLKPTGKVKNLLLSWENPEELSQFSGAADLDQVTVQDYYGAPHLGNVSGRLTIRPDGGSIDLHTTDFVMGFPDLFAENWHYDQAQGRVSWNIEAREGHERPVVTVSSNLLNLKNPSLTAAGRFSMFLPIDRRHQTELVLLIALKDADGLQAASYMPPQEVGEGLWQWVKEGIKGGRVNDGMLLLRTGTRIMEGRAPPTVQLFFDVEDATVKFQPDWPEVTQVDLLLSFDQGDLQIESRQATLLSSQAEYVSVSLPSDSDLLTVETRLSGSASDIQTLLTTSLKESVGEGFEAWELSGRHQTEVRVNLPLQGKQNPDIKVHGQLNNVQLTDSKSNISFTRVSGELDYTSARGLASKKITGQFLGRPVNARIETVPATKELPQLSRIYLSSVADASAIMSWLSLPLVNSVSGDIPLNARLDLCSGAALCNKLVVDSDLRGTAIDAPAPLGKEAGSTSSLQVVGQLGNMASVWRYNLNDKLRGVTKEDGKGDAWTRLRFGGDRPDEPTESGFMIDGALEIVNAEEVYHFLQRNEIWDASQARNQKTATKAPKIPMQIALSIGQLKMGDVAINDLDLKYRESIEGFSLAVASPQVNGELVPNTRGGYSLKLKHLKVESDSMSSLEQLTTPKSEVYDLSGWPSVDLAIDQLVWKGTPLGQWSATIETSDKGDMSLKNLQGSLLDFQFKGSAGWEIRQQQPVSFFEGTLEGKDFGQLLSTFGYSNVLESQQSFFESKLFWTGYPWHFQAPSLNGPFTMLLKKGRLVETGETSNILRIFGILNLNTLARRLSLNFSDLVEKGVAFDRLSADYVLTNGVAQSQKPLELSGPSANVELSGSLDIANQTLDSRMEVVLPVTGNLPIAAILLGAPQIAGAVFLIDKLMGDKLEKVSTLSYELSGPWGEPSIKSLVNKPDEQQSDLQPGGAQ